MGAKADEARGCGMGADADEFHLDQPVNPDSGQYRFDHAGPTGSRVGFGELDHVIAADRITGIERVSYRRHILRQISVPADGVERLSVDAASVDQVVPTACIAELRPPDCVAHSVRSSLLKRIRECIATDPAGWDAAVNAPEFVEGFDRTGDSLKRPPKGFDPEHPHIEDLKRKDHMATCTFDEEEATQPGFIDSFADACRTASPYMKFLTQAVGLPY